MSTPIAPHNTLDDVERMYRNGLASEEAVCEYLRKWNGSGKHFTVAILSDGAIRNFYPGGQSARYRMLTAEQKARFGIK